MAEFQDIIEVQDPAPLFLWWQWALIGLGGALALYLIVLLVLKALKGSNANSSISYLERALKQIELLNPASQTNNQTAVHLSLIVRQYLQNRLNDPALFETDEEFHARSEELKHLPQEAASQLTSYLEQISRFKYAPDQANQNNISRFLDTARTLLENLDRSLTTTTVTS